MITLTNQTIYKCEFCKKRYAKKANAEKHENYCGLNPKNHHQCLLSCIHLEVRSEFYTHKWTDYFGRKRSEQRTRKSFSCKFHKNKRLYSYVAEKLGFADQLDKRMPLKCKHFKYKFETDV